jgi:transcriptional regulator with XRE-family HTH domain
VHERAVSPPERTSLVDRPVGGRQAWCPGRGGVVPPATPHVLAAGTSPDAVSSRAVTGGPVGRESLGRMVRRLRLEADLTLEQLSEASGISDRALSDIERGAARGPQHRTVLAIATALALADVDQATLVRTAREGRRRVTPSPRTRLSLPRDVDDFTGRARELTTITAAMTGSTDHRPSTVVITGPPGYGKTSLAVRAAALLGSVFPNQLFLGLGGLGPEPLSADAVASRLVPELAGPLLTTGGGGGSWQPPGGRPLLVLDDAACESQVRAVLPVAGPAAVLVTSRRPLAGLEGVERVFVDRLPDEDAQQFLVAVIPAEQTAGADLAELARLCDDVPLALRIVGNRLASRPGSTAAALTARLAVEDRRLDALTAGDLRMAAAIRSSFDRLCPEAQQLFRRLALVDGSTFAAGLAGALIGQQAWQAEHLLDELADHSLVRPMAGDRYALPDLLRLFAKAELAHELLTTRAAIRETADDWLIVTAAGAVRMLRPGIRTTTSIDSVAVGTSPHRELARAWLDDEADNWSAAVRRAIRRDRGSVTPDLTEAASWLHRSTPMAPSLLSARRSSRPASARTSPCGALCGS